MKFEVGAYYLNGENRASAAWDIVSPFLALRYGIATDIEVYARTSATISYSHSTLALGTSASSRDWNDLTLGANWRVSSDNTTPALLVFAEVAAIERFERDGKPSLSYGRTRRIGLTTYRAFDPVVLSLSAGYTNAAKRSIRDMWRDPEDKTAIERVRNTWRDPGDEFFIAPGVDFAINDKVSLSGGVRFHFKGADRTKDGVEATRSSKTSLKLGLAFALNNRTTLHAGILGDLAGDGGAQANVTVVYTIF